MSKKAIQKLDFISRGLIPNDDELAVGFCWN